MSSPESIGLQGRQAGSLLDQENALRYALMFAEMAFRAEMVSTTRRSALTTIDSISLFRMLAPLSSSDDTACVCSSMLQTAESLARVSPTT